MPHTPSLSFELVFVNWWEGDGGDYICLTPGCVYAENIWSSFFNKVSHSFSFHLKNINRIIVFRLDTWKSGLSLLFRGYTKTEAAVGQEHEWVRGQTVLCRVKQGSESIFFGLRHTSTHTRTVIIGKAWLPHGPCVYECACPSEVKQHTQFNNTARMFC